MRSGVFFFFNDTATTEIYTLSLHDALPISGAGWRVGICGWLQPPQPCDAVIALSHRSEEHTSELQSRLHLVCRLLLEKKKSGPSAPTHLAGAARPPTSPGPLFPCCPGAATS